MSESVIDLSELNSLPVIALAVIDWDKDLYSVPNLVVAVVYVK